MADGEMQKTPAQEALGEAASVQPERASKWRHSQVRKCQGKQQVVERTGFRQAAFLKRRKEWFQLWEAS